MFLTSFSEAHTVLEKKNILKLYKYKHVQGYISYFFCQNKNGANLSLILNWMSMKIQLVKEYSVANALLCKVQNR